MTALLTTPELEAENVDLSTLNGLSLCSGYGGLDLGVTLALSRAGVAFRTVCYVERESYAAAILAARMAENALDPAPIWSDLRTFDGHPWRGVVDLLTAGYPCQPFSLAGKRLGEADERHLWPEVRRIIGEVRPALAFCENVSAHLSVGFDHVAEDLERLGYVVAAGVFTAWAVGAPHVRERLFWLASDPSNGIIWKWKWKETPNNFRGCAANTKDDGCRRSLSVSERLRRRKPIWDCGERWPTEPPVCGADDAAPCRLDRLRALGNGVVPEQAARAFTVLWGELSA